ncbi:baseplate megatron protein TIM-barrel domain-containing protein [Methylocella silvestris]|uniref:GTA TIM-barrel-like domain-containing protein n=1 Tax=Methylocella silvestris TaxID=199596 RepID=A0A2J7TJQ7_METSI|nr:glycoside hydrolase TIM-barrel-like domain-containing protein [Methylocella silvestris]PNG26996.1 hypothetical protein CR492_04650 [Methylocella silvestris]
MGYIPGVNLLPSTGEFTYDTIAHRGRRATERVLSDINIYAGQAAHRTDMELAIDHLIDQHPECTTVALVVAWFFNSTSAGSTNIYPSTTYIGGDFQYWNGAAYVADHWRCSGLTEASSGLIPLSKNGASYNYGGTPSDGSLVRCIQYLKSRGLRTVFYPFLLGDIPGSFPWRGLITYSGSDVSSAAASAVAAFLGSASAGQFSRDAVNSTVNYSGAATDWTYRRMILHYANLCVLAGGVDLFLLGSELRGIETLRGPAWSKMGIIGDYGLASDAPIGALDFGLASATIVDSADYGLASSAVTVSAGANPVWDYPFVTAMGKLADDVRGVFDAAGLTKDLAGLHNLVSYAADWSTWMGYQHADANGQTPHLDQLWSRANIDLVCFDNYLPLSDWAQGDGGLDARNWSAGAASAWPVEDPASIGFGLAGTPSIYRKDYLKANIEGGEKFNWFYYDSDNAAPGVYPDGSGHTVSLPSGDRLTQTRQRYYAGQEILANKQLRWWWSNPHHAVYDAGDGAGWVAHGPPTTWAARSKSTTFTEYGFATIDRSTNQPNVFYDVKSSGSATAYWSRWASIGDRDDIASYVPVTDPSIRAIGLEAIYEYWFVDGHNDEAAGVAMVEAAFCSVWNWDARPYPTFSSLSTDIWGDSSNWPTGFWLEGKLTTGVPMAYPLSWPADLRPARVLLNVNNSSRSGGQAISGAEMIVTSPAARWEGKIALPAMSAKQILAWRGFVAGMNGRYGTALIPAFESNRQNTTGVTAAAAALNATALTLTVGGRGAITAGMRFSIAGRLYEIQQSTPLGAGAYAVNILPWLRGAIAAGVACEFVNPVTTMRFTSDSEGKLDLEANVIAHPEIGLIEAF